MTARNGKAAAPTATAHANNHHSTTLRNHSTWQVEVGPRIELARSLAARAALGFDDLDQAEALVQIVALLDRVEWHSMATP